MYFDDFKDFYCLMVVKFLYSYFCMFYFELFINDKFDVFERRIIFVLDNYSFFYCYYFLDYVI